MDILNISLSADARDHAERFDTLSSPAGAIAALEQIELGLEPDAQVCSIDEAYPGPAQMRSKIRDFVGNSASPTLLFFSVVGYNAEPTLELIRELKAEFGRQVVTVVGGQLVQFARRAYGKNSDIDVVCVGDAEAILPRLLADRRRGNLLAEYEGWLSNQTATPVFSTFSYKHYYRIRERLEAQRGTAGFSQLVIQGPGGPGCSWAKFAGQACNFCSLQNISVMNGIPLKAHFESELALQVEYSPDRFFDVANQFIPVFGPPRTTSVPWLEAYITARDRLGVTVPKYVYLTVSSVSEEVGGLLARAGVVEAFIGVDHFDAAALSEEGKPWRSRKQLRTCLDSLADNGIGFRIGVVLGAAEETESSLRAVSEGVDYLLSRYHPRSLKMIGVYPVAVEPGSRIFSLMRQSGQGRDLFVAFESNGYLTKAQVEELGRLYMNCHSAVSADVVLQAACEVSDTIVKRTVPRHESRGSQSVLALSERVDFTQP